MAFDWREYRSQAFDELVGESGEPRLAAQRLIEYLSSLSEPEIAERRLASELAIKVMGIRRCAARRGSPDRKSTRLNSSH